MKIHITSHIKGHKYKILGGGYCIEKMYKQIFRRSKKTWQRARLVEPFACFRPEPKYISYFEAFMFILHWFKFDPFNEIFHKFRYLQLKPYRHGVNQAKKMTSIYANELLRKSVRTWTVLGFVKFWERGITRQWFYVINFTSLQSWKKMLSNVFVNNLKFLNEEGKMHLIDYGKRTVIFFDNITFNYSITEV